MEEKKSCCAGCAEGKKCTCDDSKEQKSCCSCQCRVCKLYLLLGIVIGAVAMYCLLSVIS